MDFSEKLRKIKEKYDRLSEQLNDYANLPQSKIIELSRDRSELEDYVNAFAEFNKIANDLESAKEMANHEDDKEMREMAEMEVDELQKKKVALDDSIRLLLLPKDPNDDKSVVMEVRAGTGGDEAALFAGNLFRMYCRYAELKGWKNDLIDISETGKGGIKEAVFSISGVGVYGNLKFESGVHRVQRVPETEANGRVHTSAASVAVLPEVEDVQVHINEADLKIDVYRSGGAGGQNVNKVETAIRITHIPTGLVVQCQDERSQLKNKEKAKKVLRARLYDLKTREQSQEIAAVRKSMVRSGDRSEKIRTYNFPQNRVTDHRIEVTLYNLSGFIDGDIGQLIEQLKIAETAEKLQAEV